MKGVTNFSDRTLSRIVNQAAATVPGVEVVSSSWAEIGTRSYPRCEVRLDFQAYTVQVDCFLAVSFPAPVTDIGAKVQENVRTWLKAMTGLDATQVNVSVEQTMLADSRLSHEDVNTGPTVPRLAPIRVRPGVTVSSPRRPGEPQVHSPVTKTPSPVSSPKMPPSRAARMPADPAPQQVRVPAEPAAPEVFSPRMPAERPLRPVTTTPQTSLMIINATRERTVPRVR